MSLLNLIARVVLAPLSDRAFLSIQYLYKQRRLPRLSGPRTLNEKIQWLKLNCRNELLVQCVDKYLVRDFVEKVIGSEYLIPLLGVYSDPREISFDQLPNQFVLKANHGSGWNLICRDKSQFDIVGAQKQFSKWLKRDFSKVGREWAYQAVPPRIVCEKFLSDKAGFSPSDYKVFCFHGKAEFIQVDRCRFVSHTRSLYSTAWEKIPCALEYPLCEEIIPPPVNLLNMIGIAERLAQAFPFVRVDLYNLDGKIYFGELTFYPGKGVERFQPKEYDLKFGTLLDLDKVCSV